MLAEGLWSDSPTDPLRIIAERKINDWIENGGLLKLPGAGRPQDLDENPFVPEDMRMAFKILSNAHVLPDWAEFGNAVENERDYLASLVNRVTSERDAKTEPASYWPLGDHSAGLRAQARRRKIEAVLVAYRQRLEYLNSLIDRFNLAVPMPILQRPRIPVERAVDKLRDALISGQG